MSPWVAGFDKVKCISISIFKRIFEYCESIASQRNLLDDTFSDMYLCYLLTVVSFHFDINKKVLDKDDRCYKQWLPMINLIITQK